MKRSGSTPAALCVCSRMRSRACSAACGGSAGRRSRPPGRGRGQKKSTRNTVRPAAGSAALRVRLAGATSAGTRRSSSRVGEREACARRTTFSSVATPVIPREPRQSRRAAPSRPIRSWMSAALTSALELALARPSPRECSSSRAGLSIGMPSHSPTSSRREPGPVYVYAGVRTRVRARARSRGSARMRPRARRRTEPRRCRGSIAASRATAQQGRRTTGPRGKAAAARRRTPRAMTGCRRPLAKRWSIAAP